MFLNAKFFCRSVKVFRFMVRQMYSTEISIPQQDPIVNKVKSFILRLRIPRHKGTAGKIGIVGGSLEYSGAPYFAAMSALRTGADLAHIFCCKEASTPIKCYSPEVIVHPVLDDQHVVELFEQWLSRFHVILIGPGLGRNQDILNNVAKLINSCREADTPLVIDADGLFLVAQQPNLIKNYPTNIILTPNFNEYAMLVKTFLHDKDAKKFLPNAGSSISEAGVKALAEAIGPQAIVIAKGEKDIIASGQIGSQVVSCTTIGSGRRCGGQGDILAGSLCTFKAWSLKSDDPLAPIHASYAACKLVRLTNYVTFKVKHRQMLATDMLGFIGNVFYDLFEIEKTVDE